MATTTQNLEDRSCPGSSAASEASTIDHPQSRSQNSVAPDIDAANQRVADYLVQTGWSREAATQRASRLVIQAWESATGENGLDCLTTQRRLVRAALLLAIESAVDVTRHGVVPRIQPKPMNGGGQAQRLKWLCLTWWSDRLRFRSLKSATARNHGKQR